MYIRKTQNKSRLYTGCLKKNGPRYTFAIDDPNEKNCTGNEMTLKTLQT
jgi:tRNA U34 5-carboxymethylaminomethyl modifying enzyme MnmG/GidA